MSTEHPYTFGDYSTRFVGPDDAMRIAIIRKDSDNRARTVAFIEKREQWSRFVATLEAGANEVAAVRAIDAEPDPEPAEDSLTNWEREQVRSGKAVRDGKGIKLKNPDMHAPPASEPAQSRAERADAQIARELESPGMADAIERVEAMDAEPIEPSPQTREIGRSAAEKFATASDEIDIPETAHHHPDWIPPAASGEHYARTGSGELIGPYSSAEEAERERIASETESEREKVLALAVELSSDSAALFDSVDGPGKFDSASDRMLAAAMLEIAGHGAEDERAGDVESTGAAWRVGRFIAVEDSQGFVSVDAFDSSEIATAELAKFDPPSEDEPLSDAERASLLPDETAPDPQRVEELEETRAEESEHKRENVCPDCGRPIEKRGAQGIWSHVGIVDDCWRMSYDGPQWLQDETAEAESDESEAETIITPSNDGSITINANGAALRAWAHEPGNSWPCSELAKLRSVHIKLAPNGDLVELGCDPEYKAGGKRSEPSADELNAWQDAALKGFPPIERTIRRTLTRDLPNGSRIVANVELRKDGDRGLSGGFSVTGELYEKHGTWTGAAQQRNGRDWDAGGCLHDELSKAFPKLRPLIALHLSAEDGTPMHAEADARYWHEQSAGMIPIGNTYGREKDRGETQAAYCRRLACETLRVEALPAFLDRLAERVLDAANAAKENLGAATAESTERERKAYREAFAAFVDAQRGRWAREAIIGRHAIESMPEAD